ncbi:c-type cytochrome [Seonamhaeicola algicola]|uniref:C-type cytochrome n=1 Tax=Seonamhaeicola algicola TaxID=1719036 RepID=A0A5C7AGX7_9FLAO|nr:PVC-type heme-binding CxxCH protein [Seonamhaeicola algicola]TXE07149.1 c-type cytochrome [Seonamhaeicola algicola]
MKLINVLSSIFKAELYCIVIVLLIYSCKPKNFDEPQISLDNYKIESGFKLQAVASEPFIEAPVAMDFDNKGRMWVVEMKGYMQNLNGTGDDLPNGTISILEDLDNDGITDHAKVFLDSLVLPRAIAHVYGGLLYAEPPNLWFVDIENDMPKNRVLVDSLYSDGGNVEHQPNGLLLHIDNWIYNAKSHFKYQRKNNKWIKKPTAFRGQWGITKDNFGRLYYNTNSVQLLGDYVLPNTLTENPYYKPQAGLNNKLTPNQRLYPLHATAVNRGYVKGVLSADSLLLNVTSACGPLIYRGNKFSNEYKQNAFVCAPEANIVKRNILTFEADSVTAKQAIEGEEFLAATEEGFRPVNLNNGPDGNLYIVDMHRGIIQDKAFMTPYLRSLLAKKQLDTIIGMGRILKVSAENSPQTTAINLDDLNTKTLVNLLNSDNGWLRDRAQHILIYKNDKAAIPLLKNILKNNTNEIANIHALYTLHGLNALNFNYLNSILKTSSVKTICHTLVLLKAFASEIHISKFNETLQYLLTKNNPEIDLYALSSLKNWLQLNTQTFFPVAHNIVSKYKNNTVYYEALINGLSGVEAEYVNYISSKEVTPGLKSMLNLVVANRVNKKQNGIYTRRKTYTDSRTAGYITYKNMCATCHGFDGEGIESLAPPLMNSEYITEASEKRLALVLLHGLTGPVHVNGKLYELSTTMPGLANNPDFSDADILNIIKYLKSAFAGTSEKITIDDLKSLRKLTPENGAVYTEKELADLIEN